jgi:amino acid permease
MANHQHQGNGKKSNGQVKFAHDLGLIDALAIGLGTMMGAGIFVLSAEAANRAGPGATFTYMEKKAYGNKGEAEKLFKRD